MQTLYTVTVEFTKPFVAFGGCKVTIDVLSEKTWHFMSEDHANAFAENMIAKGHPVRRTSGWVMAAGEATREALEHFNRINLPGATPVKKEA